jgi:hypothetical protein
MKFVIFVEGPTEAKVLPPFLKRWLDPQLPHPVGVKPVKFEGWSDYNEGIGKKAALNLNGDVGADVIAGIGILDLHGPTIFPDGTRAAKDRCKWAREYFEDKVRHPRFRQHFAVHETEAWLLADPTIFPHEVRKALPGTAAHPETVNFDEPPAKLLDRLYRAKVHKGYGKILDGVGLFQRLNPVVAAQKCPGLKTLLHDMLTLARAAL